MKNTFLRMALLLAGLLFTTSVLAVMGQEPVPEGAYDGVLVKFKSGTRQSRIDDAFDDAGSQQNNKFSSHLVRGLTHANVGRKKSLSSTLRSLRDDDNVEFAEPNYILSAYVLPNDPQFNSLWGLNNTGQTGGVADADIDAPEAWDVQTGTDVIVAVVDSGVAYNHADLRGNIWRNTAEIANNGVDDDGNGYVDDVRGWDFVNNDNDPMDDNDHGTHVAGTIAASGNNGAGVVGVSWTARIMPLKFMSNLGNGTMADAIGAIDYAVANGAKVISASWGMGNFSAALRATISAANNAGVLFVAAAGNSSSNNDATPNYPADYNLPNVISVAATDDADTLAGFSNFGANSVDLGAPGVNIMSTVRFNGYASFSGTSMAVPYVVGAAALVIAENPGIDIPTLRATLLDSTDAVADLAGRTVTGGRLNVFAALGGGVTPPPPPPPPTPPTPVVTVTPARIAVLLGSNVQFSARGGSTPYVWSVSNSAIGSVSANGNFTGLVVGMTNVTATDANGVVSNSAVATVNATATINIMPNNVTLRMGEVVTLSATGGNAPYTWVSNSPGVATIGAVSGELTAQATGTTIVTVTDNSGNFVNTGSIPVTPAPPPVNIVITPAGGTVAVGSIRNFTAAGGSAPYSWSVSDTTIASINAAGALIGLAAGSVVVTATDANGDTGDSTAITVTAAPVGNPPGMGMGMQGMGMGMQGMGMGMMMRR